MTPKTRILLGVTGGIAAYKSPDLVRRLKEDLALAELDPATTYGKGPDGYTTYPALA